MIQDLERLAEQYVDQQMKSNFGQTPVKNVTFRDPKTGSTSRVDSTVKTSDDKLVVRETKANGSQVRTNQSNVLRAIKGGSAVPAGARAEKVGLRPGVPVGQQVKGTDVAVSRVTVGGGAVQGVVETPVAVEPPAPVAPIAVEDFFIP